MFLNFVALYFALLKDHLSFRPIETGVMEISLLKALLKNISSFFHLSSYDNINLEPVLKYYQRTEEILKLLNAVLEVIHLQRDEVFKKSFEELSHSIDDLRDQFENWQPLSSKVYFVSCCFYPVAFSKLKWLIYLINLRKN